MTATTDDRAPRAAAATAKPGWGYRPELDGIRTIAVYLVVLHHCRVPALSGGFIGVDLFFVLSGFLVTSVLLAEAAERGGISVTAFYARRVRRLLPAAVLVIVATCVLQLLVASLPQRVAMVDDARSALLYVANWRFILDARDYFAATDDPSPFLHYWSLSIEEQFYVVLPLLLWLVWRRSSSPVRTLAVVAGAVTAVSLVLQVWRAGGDPTYAYYATDTRVYQLTAGVLLACAVSARRARAGPSPARVPRAGTVATLAGLALLLGLAALLDDLSASWRGIGAAVASVTLLAGLHLAPGSVVARALSLEPVRYLGTISYSVYLWHWPLVLLIDSVLDVGPWALVVGVAVSSTALAALSDRLLERPVRGSRLLGARPRLVVACGLAVSVAAALLVVQPVLSDPRRPAVASTGSSTPGAPGRSPVLDRPVPEGLDLVGALADVPESGGICTREELDACLRVDGGSDGLHVVLVGDSHAAMFVDAFVTLAEERDWTLHTSVIQACSWQQGLQNELSSPEAQAECRTAREDFYADVLPQLDADVVVAISLPRSDREWEKRLTAEPAPPGETLVERQLRTSRDTVAAVAETGVPLVLVQSVFGTGGYGRKGPDPLDCLARATVLGDCAVVPPLARPAADAIYRVLDAESDEVSTVDLTPDICLTPPLCQPVRGRTVIWKDPDHITGRFAVEQRERFLDRFRRAAPDVGW